MKRMVLSICLLLTGLAFAANEIHVNYDTGSTLYFVRFNSAGQAGLSNGSSFENWVAADIYDVTMAEIGSGGGHYIGNWGSVAVGRYSFTVFKQAGANPANGDEKIAVGDIVWLGTAEEFPPTKAEMDANFINTMGVLDTIDYRIADTNLNIDALNILMTILINDANSNIISIITATKTEMDANFADITYDGVAGKKLNVTYISGGLAEAILYSNVWSAANGAITNQDVLTQAQADANYIAIMTLINDANDNVIAGLSGISVDNNDVLAAISAADVNILAAIAAIDIDVNDINLAGVEVVLASNGLDNIPITDPNGLANTWPEFLVQLHRLQFKKMVRTPSYIYLYNDAGNAKTKQEWSDDGTNQIMQDAENYGD